MLFPFMAEGLRSQFVSVDRPLRTFSLKYTQDNLADVACPASLLRQWAYPKPLSRTFKEIVFNRPEVKILSKNVRT